MASRHAQRAKDTYWTDESFEKVDTLRSMAAETGYEPAQLVIAWALSKPAVTSVIVGASRPEQVTGNAEASTIELSADLLERLDAL
jgi:aryl-alcohol dehydrogenase-like predicted oxidoreductase